MKLIKKENGYVKSYDGTRIYYEVRGEGQPIIMAYGIGCLTNHWLPQLKYFSQKYQTIVFDFRAHHKSELPADKENIGIECIAKDIAEVINHLGIESASFWGHSFGVQTLLKTYDLYPNLFKNLVFVNGFASDPITPMFGNGVALKIFEFLKAGHLSMPETSAYIWKALTTNPLSIQVSGLLGGFNLSLTQLKDVEIYARGLGSLDLGSYLKLFEDMIAYDGRPVYEKIKVPTLIVSGQKDSVTPQDYQQEMHTKINNSQFISIPYGSHCTQLDMPDYVNLSIERFLSDINY